MAEARRHSVDIPLSKALVALKRVRSLRDPATNSMSKFVAVMENVNWETNSCNGAPLDVNDDGDRQLVVTQSRIYDVKEEGEDHGTNCEADHSSRIPHTRNTSSRGSSTIKGLEPTRTKKVHKARRVHTCKSSDSMWVRHPSNNVEEEVNSYKESNFELTERVNTAVVKKSGHGNRRKSSTAVSRVGSPCMSTGKVHTHDSRLSSLGLATQETQIKSSDVLGSNFSGCGISYCWSGTPKYKGPNLYSDDEDQEQPLLSAEGTETTNRDTTPYPESPRSLSQKYRPKSFHELVGLNVVSQSLLYAISKGKIAPLYLFHGPRGTGKTSTARIFAAALNCLSFGDQRPCGSCRECVYLFSGRSRDVKELDAAKINGVNKVKSLLKSASLVPCSARFKVFIIDECQSLQGEAWAAILKSLDELSRHAIYVMITSDPDDLPRSSVSRCQRYHFPRIKDADIVCRLQRICIEEGLEFDKDALYFIAAKSNGSLRDAETMLDQLGLLGKKITMSLAYELIGVVSDDELLDLLDLALSADTANTVKRARELMTLKVDPLQLAAQLANLIMDILAGRFESGFLEAGRDFFRRHAFAEVGMQKLRHALKLLSETEKQLRTSRNQATWLTVALLQFSTEESSPLRMNDSETCVRKACMRDDQSLSTTSPWEGLKGSICHACNQNKSNCSERDCSRKKLENIWSRAIRKCQSTSFKNFLLKEGYLSSVSFNEGLANAEVEFCHPDHVSRAEKSGVLIASLLQHALGCDVEIRVKLVSTSIRRNSVRKKSSFSFLRCYGKPEEVSDSNLTDGDETDTSGRREPSFKVYTSHHGQQLSPFIQQSDAEPLQDATCFHDLKAITISNVEENAQSDATMGTNRSSRDDHATMGTNRSSRDDQHKRCKLESNSLKRMGEEGHFMSIQECEVQPSCFAKTLKLQKKFFSSDAAHTICLRMQPQSKQDLTIPKKSAFDTYFSTYDPYNLCSRSNSHITCSSRDENMPSKDSSFSSKLLCWRVPNSPI